MSEPGRTGLLGARSLVGECVIPQLLQEQHALVAFSRKSGLPAPEPGLCWHTLGIDSPDDRSDLPIRNWLSLLPVWQLPQYFPLLANYGARRVVALSSTSRFSKADSPDPEEQRLAQLLAEGETQLQAWAERSGVEWLILRPTLIYGRGRDKNIAEIARFIKRFGFFPLLGPAQGLRQPVHGEDVAAACVAALQRSLSGGHHYTLSGSEVLAYREMVTRVFGALQRRPRLLRIPLPLFKAAVSCLRRWPRYRHWNVAMALRMNLDLVFDHDDAARELGFSPRPFLPTAEDVML